MKKNSRSFLFTVIMVILFMSPVFAEDLRMLVYEGYAPEKHIELFKQSVKDKYGVKLNVDVKYISEISDIYKALKNKETDIVSASHNLPKDSRYKYIDGKLVLPVDLKNISNFKNILPDIQKTDYLTQDGDVYGIPFSYGGYGLAYNTGIVKEEPKTWNILWEPEYSGKYTLSSAFYDANINITALAMGIEKNKIYQYDSVSFPEFLDKLKYLAKNARSFYGAIDDADTLQGLSLAVAWGFSFSDLKKRGENWKFAFPKEGTTGWIDYYMISHTLRDKPEMKRIAEEWLDYVISPDFQVDQVVRTLGVFPVNPGIKDRLTLEEIESLHINDPDFFKKNFIPWDILDKRSRKGFNLLWKKASR